MRPVHTRPKFRCDFCRFTATAPSVEKHERICWQNPNRYCPTCDNSGWICEEIPGAGTKVDPCHYCSRRHDDGSIRGDFSPAGIAQLRSLIEGNPL